MPELWLTMLAQSVAIAPGFAVPPQYVMGALAFAAGYGVLHQKTGSVLREVAAIEARVNNRLELIERDVKELIRQVAHMEGEMSSGGDT